MPAILTPAFSPAVANYRAGYDDEELMDYDGELTVTAVPADGVTVEIIGQSYDGSAYTDETVIENGGSFVAAGTDRLVITCEKDGRSMKYYASIDMVGPTPHPKS